MLSKEKQKAIIEALLFVSTQPLSVGKIVRKLKKAARLASSSTEATADIAVRQAGETSKVIRPSDNVLEEIFRVAAENDDGDRTSDKSDESDESEKSDSEEKSGTEEADIDVIEIDSLEIDEEADNDNQILASNQADDEAENQDDEDGDDDIMKQLLKKQEELEEEISHTDVKTLLKEIQQELSNEDRGVELVTVAKGYQFRTKYDISMYLKDEKIQVPSRFSPSALEALAIVAYQQPITRQKIEDVRGVDSGGVLKTLLDKGILRVVGRSDEPGKPLVYGTSKRFLEIFSLKAIRDLPNLQDYHSLQLSQDKDELETTYQQTSEIHVDDLVEEDYTDLSEAERAVLDDLDQTMKDLKKVEKEVLASQKTEEEDSGTEGLGDGETGGSGTVGLGDSETGDSETVGLGDGENTEEETVLDIGAEIEVEKEKKSEQGPGE